MNKSALLATVAFGAMSLSAGGSLAATAAATAAQPSTTIGEVVVTAERREANLQNVPEAVTAFTAKQRNLLGISTIQDVTNFTPGLTYSSQLDRPAMRGLAKNNNIYLADSAVAIYYDDFYSTSTYLVGRDDMLIDQVEVLLGPQGTLYGRNAIGGLINTISKKPNTNELGGEVRAIVGNYGYTKFEGTVTGPITDKLSFRLSGFFTNQNDGYYHNIVPGMPSEGGVVHDPYVDLQLQYKTEKDELWLDSYVAAFNNDRGGPGSTLNIPTVGHYDTSLVSPGNTVFNPNFPYGGTGFVPGSVVGQIGTDNPSLNNIRNFAHSIPTDVNLNAAYAVVGHWTHHFDGADLKYVGGYSQYHYDLVTSSPDYGNSPITSYQLPLDPGSACTTLDYLGYASCGPLTVNPAVTGYYDARISWWSQELTLSSTTDGPLQWIAGAFYYHESDDNISAAGQMKGQSQLDNPLYLDGTAAISDPGRYYDFHHYNDTVQSAAAYGQLDYKVTDTIKLTGGLRFTYDWKSGTEQMRDLTFQNISTGTGLLYGTGGLPVCDDTHKPPLCTLKPGEGLNYGNMGSLLPAFDITTALSSTGVNPNGSLVKGVSCARYLVTTGNYAGDWARCLSGNSSAVTGTAGVEWTPDRNTLVYARYNRGYKAFGLNAGDLSANPYAAPEFVNDFELGLKKTINHTLTIDADAFYYDYSDDQVPLGFPTGTALGSINLTEFVNVPKAISDGFDIQATWRPIDHLVMSLTYGFNYSSIQSTCTAVNGVATGACYIDFLDPTASAPNAHPVGNPVDGNRYQSVNGNPLPQAPENKVAFNANYTFVFDPGNLTLSGTFIWKDNSYQSLFVQPFYEAPSWNQVDLRAVWSGNHDKYEVVLYMKNVFNSLGYEAALAGSPNGAPVGGGGYTTSSNYDLTPPRTYGFEVHYKF